MNWYKRAQLKRSILEIATAVRNEEVAYWGDEILKAQCLNISRILRDRLIQEGYKAQVVQGSFILDEPSLEFETDADLSEEEMMEVLHYWVEVDGLIVDITASQFNDELIYEKMDTIEIGAYQELSRYKSLRKGWQ